MQLLCIVSNPRSGTNHLTKLLQSVPNLRSQKEIFHSEASYTLDGHELSAVGRYLREDITQIDDPRLTGFARHNPVDFLNCLVEANQHKDVLSFKIFPAHLGWQQIGRMVRSFPQMQFMTLRRRFLDTYISFQKAMALGEWSDVDTSQVSVRIDADAYLKWVGDMTHWYSQWADLLSAENRTSVEITYEDAIAPGNKATLNKVHEATTQLGLNLGIQRDTEATGLMRQDRSTAYHEKVENWDKFMSDLTARGLLPAEA